VAFSEDVKLKVKRKAHFSCCLCEGLYVEIHHLVPVSEGGPDTEDNAAPLCPSCHETYGANPTKRKFITERREFWYEVCASRLYPDADRIEQLMQRLDEATAAVTGFQEFVKGLPRHPVAREVPASVVSEVPKATAHAEAIPPTVHVTAHDSATIHSEESATVEIVESEDEWNEEDFQQEPRTEIEILEALEKLFDQIWYNRHWGHRIDIEEGRDTVTPEIWKMMLAAAARVEEKYKDDPEALGPWSDFEWGMLNGKMSALRWVLGDEWDFLDT